LFMKISEITTNVFTFKTVHVDVPRCTICIGRVFHTLFEIMKLKWLEHLMKLKWLEHSTARWYCVDVWIYLMKKENIKLICLHRKLFIIF
jgi:hypothetical protein